MNETEDLTAAVICLYLTILPYHSYPMSNISIEVFVFFTVNGMFCEKKRKQNVWVA